ncbi:MAG: enoyl-CoA hydratase/isomerase family protein [Proteobacteria bacterium]|nr:enoyl-CoA hydratase/isomerase family protein [Pseudomonadota bacterium]
MDTKHIEIDISQEVAVITLNRPEQMNAISELMRYELCEAIEEINGNDDVGAMVITGAGKHFCTGADVSRFAGTAESAPPPKREWTRQLLESKPVVAAINGYAIGAGLTRTLNCDVRVASTNALFSMRFIRLGLAPTEFACSKLLPHLIGLQAALDLAMSGRMIDASEAHRLGLVHKVFEPETLLEEAVKLAADYAANPREAVAAAKRIYYQNLTEQDLDLILTSETEAFEASGQSPEHREAVAAFSEKRKPDFKSVRRS